MARIGLHLTFADLAELADVSTNTLTRFESGAALRPRTVAAIRSALEKAGARFRDDGEWAGVDLKVLVESEVAAASEDVMPLAEAAK